MMAVLRSAYHIALSILSPPRPAPGKSPRRRLQLEELEARALPSLAGGAALAAAPQFHLTPLFDAASTPYTPDQVRHAYGIDQLPYDGSGQTIAIVDAYDDPNIASDLAAFDRKFGIAAPPSFVKATPDGTPGSNAGWAGEISLDVEWAHAVAPKAKILLVEALSASDGDLLSAVDYARQAPGVVVVSMSWGGNEFTGEAGDDVHFTTPSGHGGVAFVASAGDDGSGAEWPSVSPNVLAVGGTSLTITTDNGWGKETGWSSGGGGRSLYEAEPSFQRGLQGSGKRDDPDVAYNADPNTGFYVYDTVPDSSGDTGWFAYGGTSAGAPQWAALIALADQGRAKAGLGSLTNAAAAIYSLPAKDFHDVTAGNNGDSASSGYDLVTGRGSPLADQVVAGLVNYGAAAPAKAPVPKPKPAPPTRPHYGLPAAATGKPSAVRDRTEEALTELLRGLHGAPHRPEEDWNRS